MPFRSEKELYLLLRHDQPRDLTDIKITSRFIFLIICASVSKRGGHDLTAAHRTLRADLSSGAGSPCISPGIIADPLRKCSSDVLLDHGKGFLADKVLQLVAVIPEIYRSLCYAVKSLFPGGGHLRIKQRRNCHVHNLINHLAEILRA